MKSLDRLLSISSAALGPHSKLDSIPKVDETWGAWRRIADAIALPKWLFCVRVCVTCLFDGAIWR